eukprot:GILK01007138.1.p1 GENE.GILK01007138.1~~GILK01007138.1.p1  ORF type:complete len:635 (+),score=84.57 GILK01007138.1:37-1905(+)
MEDVVTDVVAGSVGDQQGGASGRKAVDLDGPMSQLFRHTSSLKKSPVRVRPMRSTAVQQWFAKRGGRRQKLSVEQEERLRAIFRDIDLSSNGLLDAVELRLVAEALGSYVHAFPDLSKLQSAILALSSAHDLINERTFVEQLTDLILQCPKMFADFPYQILDMTLKRRQRFDSFYVREAQHVDVIAKIERANSLKTYSTVEEDVVAVELPVHSSRVIQPLTESIKPIAAAKLKTLEQRSEGLRPYLWRRHKQDAPCELLPCRGTFQRGVKSVTSCNGNIVLLTTLGEVYVVNGESQTLVLVNAFWGLHNKHILSTHSAVYTLSTSGIYRCSLTQHEVKRKKIHGCNFSLNKVRNWAAGANHFIVNQGGRLFCWGSNNHGQLGLQAQEHQIVGLTIPQDHKHENAQLDAMLTKNRLTQADLDILLESTALEPKLVRGLDDILIQSVSCGAQHSLALSSTGAVYSWGYGALGQLGLGHRRNAYLPTQITIFNGDSCVARTIDCGDDFSAVLTGDGQVYTFGCGWLGQLGDGERGNSTVPQLVQHELTNKKCEILSCGPNGVTVVTEESEIYCWGRTALGNSTSDVLLPTLLETGDPIPNHKICAVARLDEMILFLLDSSNSVSV